MRFEEDIERNESERMVAQARAEGRMDKHVAILSFILSFLSFHSIVFFFLACYMILIN